MSTYVVGDIQGCLSALKCLLEKVNFDPARDQLLLAGDLVARGEDSLGTLRLIYQLRDCTRAVLGNHDLHLLALAAGAAPLREKERDLRAILDAADRDTLLGWLRHQPLALELPQHHSVLTHAGLPPGWSVAQTLARAAEVEAALRGAEADDFYRTMYGNTPRGWSDELSGNARLRVITNYLTRMRFVDVDGALDLTSKGEADAPPAGFVPWFLHPARQDTEMRVLFGHWAALAGNVPASANVAALDTGCVWGGRLTALRLEDNQRQHCDCAR